MRLFLSSIGRREWLAQLNKIEMDKKWFLSINNHRKPEFFGIYFSPMDEERIQIGACAFTKFDVFVDCSIFIFPEYQRNGNAKQPLYLYLIQYLFSKFAKTTKETGQLHL